jgi:uncharacterized repeat protein (TIGR01451 family)
LGIGQSSVITFVVTVDADLEGGHIIRNTATVRGDGVEDDDYAETTVADGPGVSIEKSTAPVAVPGEDLTYTITVVNTGNTVLTGLTVTDSLPAALRNPRNLAVDGPGSGSFVGQNLTVNIPSLGIGQSSVITFVVTVDADLEGGHIIRNTATVRGDGDIDSSDEASTIVINEPPPTGRDALRDILEDARGLTQANFSGANWRIFLPAINHAQRVYDNPNSTQEEIENATNTLRNLVNRANRN